MLRESSTAAGKEKLPSRRKQRPFLHTCTVLIVISRRGSAMFRVGICSAIFLGASAAQAPTPTHDSPRFDVAAIHLSDPRGLAGISGCQTTIGLMRCINVTLKRCIVGAYRIGADRVVGGPNWIDTDRFQITGKTDQPLGDKGLMEMLQTLLAERFKLVLDRKSRPSETMILGVAKDGPKFQRADRDARASWQNMHDHLEATRITIGDFVEILSRNLNVPVMDHTGLAGAYDFTLRWNPDYADSLDRDEARAALMLEMSTAITRELGLTLKSRKLPVEILVIRHAEKPSEN
jgi:uncharacterized protein (TIGR03435 family)